MVADILAKLLPRDYFQNLSQVMELVLQVLVVD